MSVSKSIENEIRELQRKLKEKEMLVSEKNEQISTIQNTLDIKLDLVTELKGIIQCQTATIESLKLELNDTKKEVESKNEIIISTERALDNLQEKFDSSMTEKSAMKLLQFNKKEQITQQQEMIEQLNNQLLEVNNQIIEMTEKNDEFNRVRKNLEVNLKHISDLKEQKEQQIQLLTSQLAEKSESYQNLKFSFEFLTKEFDNSTTNCASLTAQLAEATEKFKQYEEEQKATLLQYQDSFNTIDQLKQQIEQQKKEIEKLQAEKETLNATLTASNQTNAQFCSKIDELEKLLRSAHTEIAQLQQTNDQIIMQNSRLQNKLKLIDSIKTERKNLKKIQTIQLGLLEEFNKAKDELAARKKSLDSLNQQLSSLKAQEERSDVTEHARNTIQSTKVVLLQELKNDRESLKQSVDVYNQNQFKLKVCDEEISKIQTNIGSLQNDLLNLE